MNLKFFNFSVYKTSFKMETLKSIIAAMCPHQWLTSIDLKDAYFHIGVVPAHLPVLEVQLTGPVLSV